MSNLPTSSAMNDAAPFPWLALAVISIGTFLGPLNGVIVGVALPTISREFSIDLQSVKWLVLIYLVVTTFLLPVVGLLGKRFGETRIFIAGYAICIVGTTACAMAPESNFWLLVAARAAQAVGSACIYALFGALVVRTVPSRYRGLGFGLTGASVAISLVVAPILGGILLHYLSWPWVFWIQLPVQLAGLILSAMVLPRRHAPALVKFPMLNILSWLGVVCGLVLFVEAFSKGLWREFMPLTGAVTLAAIVAFGLTERARHKLFDFSLFSIRAFGLGSLGLLLLNTGLFIFMLFTPFLLEDYMGLNQRQMGMYLAIAPLVTLIAAPAAGRLSDRIGYRLLVVLAFGCAVGGYSALALLGAQGSVPMIIGGLVLLGLAGGMFNAPAMSAMMGSVSELQRTQASSLGSLMRNLGFLAGTSLGSLAFSLLILNIGGREMMIAARTAELAEAVPGPEFAAAYAATMWVCAGLQLVALVVSLRFPRRIAAAAQ
jgi:EmrB/QacA subfamily drug resistance transporter